MGKKSFGDLSALTPLVRQIPTQQVEQPAAPAPVAPAAPTLQVVASVPAPLAADPVVKQTFELREGQRDELERLAREAKLPVRAFILTALAAKGLMVLESDLVDGRKRRRS